ncbi:hypothetical protein ABI59_23105 [Acidobacteria bacterium Mor1]|nr:hypothetical protein ABI59_23105 [Acidobacteria bacterium Mor1]
MDSPPARTDDPRLEKAEGLIAEGSYALALPLLEALAAAGLPEDEARWIDFRLADTRWRALAGSKQPDPGKLEQARQALDLLIRDIKREQDRDRVWVEVQESLGDFWWVRPEMRDWGSAWNHYQQALQWWAGSTELTLARDRYLSIVWRAARPPQARPYEHYGYYGNQMPLQVLENALSLARDRDERARASYLLASSLRYQGSTPRNHRRTREAFETAVETGAGTDWFDDALYNYAEWLAGGGKLEKLPQGGYRQQPDFPRALELYRRVVREFAKGESRYHDQARSRIEQITKPQAGVSVSNAFLPGSEVQYQLSWRNVGELDLALYPVTLTRDLEPRDNKSWIDWIRLPAKPLRAWKFDTEDNGEHLPGQKALTLDDKLASGAYVLQARGAGQQSRALVLVSRASVVVKAAAGEALAWVVDAVDGTPRDAAAVLWIRDSSARKGERWSRIDGKSGDDGLVRFPIPDSRRYAQLWVAIEDGDHQAFAQSYSQGHHDADGNWKLYAFTDRPAYRPGETVEWKVVARTTKGMGYDTPSGRVLHWEIFDPRGTKVAEGDSTLNDFGSFWSSLEVTEEMPLGEYQLRFTTADKKRNIGNARLFRLEEYKLPEFKVTVEPPVDDEGKPRSMRMGETVEASVTAEYYFGGPVAEASVEVLVYQKPLWIYMPQPRKYPWYFEDRGHAPYWGGGSGQIVHRETLATDAEGRATVRFDTPENAGQDFEYTVEARVIDASRREILGRGSLKVGRQGHYPFIRPDHYLHRPGQPARFNIDVVDANRRPVEVEGTLRVTRQRWTEVWLDPYGREVRGAELDKIRRRGDFPPMPPRPGDPGWRVKFRGYKSDEVLTRKVRTDAEGKAELSFVPDRPGYYQVAWESIDTDELPIETQAAIWVAERDSTDLGYHRDGVEIILDKDTFRSGHRTPVMLVSQLAGAHVLFTVEAGGILEHRVVKLNGTVKLVELDVDERWVPDVHLEAAMVMGGMLHRDSKPVVVPAEKQFVNVSVEGNAESYLPGDEGTLEVTTTDHEGNPVSAEIALGLVDASVFYIQEDLAGDPRPFFYGSKRGNRVRTNSSFDQFQYVQLVRDEDGGDLITYDSLKDLPISRTFTSNVALAPGAMDLKEESGARMRGAVAQKSMRRDQFAAAPMAMEADAESLSALGYIGGGDSDDGQGGGDTVEVRSDFRSTVFWQPDVVTGADGKATVEVSYPDSLTTWHATARAVTAHSAFGFGEADTRTNKPLIVRLQAPRFFVAGDKVTLSAIVNNNGETDLTVTPSLDVAGLVLDGRGTADAVRVPAGGETRVDWTATARVAGDATLRAVVRADGHSDAMEREYPVFEHGIDKLIARSGKVRGDDVTVTLELPDERRSTVMTVQVTPSMAVTMLDALPYLIDYPYGCTEQTMSRFLPAVITARTLEQLGIEQEAIAGRMFGGIEAAHADSTHPKGAKDLAELDAMVQAGLKRLADFQRGDGGWGWWKDSDSDPFMTAYVVWGLALADDAGVKIERNRLRRAVNWLDKELVNYENRPEMLAWLLHAVSVAGEGKDNKFRRTAFDNLWAQKNGLNAYTRALFALAAHELGATDKAQTLVRNLSNGVQRDRKPDTSIVIRGGRRADRSAVGTAHWGADGVWWRWADSPVESTAFALRAMLAVDPDNELIEPTINWLIKNRRGAQWSNTRDTAIAVMTLADYLVASGELSSDLEYELSVNGETVARERVTPSEVLSAPSRFTVPAELVRDGENEIRIVRTSGEGPLYFSAEAEFFSLENPIAAAGNELFVRRQYLGLIGKPTLLQGYRYEQQPLHDGATLRSGDRVQVVLTIEAKNDYEYLLFEDLKPAGLEAIALQSGAPVYARQLRDTEHVLEQHARDQRDYTGRSVRVYQELRDRKVAAFIDKLPQGLWEIRYDLRAEVPGYFHALPLMGHAMYVPEIRANGAEVRITVEDR